MIAQNHQKITKDLKVVNSLKNMAIVKEEQHLGDLESEAMDRLRYILEAHNCYLESITDEYDATSSVGKELTGFFFLVRDSFNEIQDILSAKDKYIKGLEERIGNSLFTD